MQRMRTVRERLWVTQAELAARAGVTKATVSRLENGLQRPRISTVRKLAAALGVAPEEIVDRADEDSAEAARDGGGSVYG